MKNLLKIAGSVLIIVGLFFLSPPAAQANCMSECLATGASVADCASFCNPSSPPPEFDDPGDAIDPIEAPTNETFDALNPLQIAGGETVEASAPSEYAEQLSTPGGIITRMLEFIFPIAGLILFLMISWGGFEVLSGAGDSSKVTAGKQRVTAAIVGFLILFASYWMVQIMELVFGVVIF